LTRIFSPTFRTTPKRLSNITKYIRLGDSSRRSPETTEKELKIVTGNRQGNRAKIVWYIRLDTSNPTPTHFGIRKESALLSNARICEMALAVHETQYYTKEFD
jgi:hypothetical protein